MARYMGVDEKKAQGLAKQIFKKVDLNNSGAIDFSGTPISYSEFIMCASNIELTVTEDNLDIAFDYIDEVALQ